MHRTAQLAPGLCLDPARAALITSQKTPYPAAPSPQPFPARWGGDTSTGDIPKLRLLKALGEGGCREPGGPVG